MLNILLLLPLLFQINTSVYAEVTLIPLHPHPSTLNKNRRQNTVTNQFQNSVVYDRIKLLRNSGDRGERLLTYYKQARFQQHDQRRQDQQTTNTARLGKSKIPSKERITEAVAVFPLFQGLGSHYIKAHVGTPPQVTTLLVDTGSEMTGFPCVGCSGCGNDHTNAYFDQSKSHSFENIGCDEGKCEDYGSQCSDDKCLVGVSYMEGSNWKGYVSRDLFSLAINDENVRYDLQVNFTFACETSESGLFESQLENGIMGLMNEAVLHLPKVLKEEKKMSSNEFSLCMSRALSTSKDGVYAGIMALGGFDDSHHTSPMVYAKNTKSFGYNVVIRKMYLQTDDGKITPISADYQDVHDVLVDSGTTLTYLSTEIGDEFSKVWKDVTGIEYSNNKIQLNQLQLSKLPTILIQLEGMTDPKTKCQDVDGLAGTMDDANCHDVVLKVPPSHYMFYYGGNKYSCELHFENKKGGIIGGNVMQGHDVFFDNENARIGFAESSCDYSDNASVDKKP